MTSKFRKTGTFCSLLLILVQLLFVQCLAEANEELFSYSSEIKAAQEKIYDPLEKVNRQIFSLNSFLFKKLISSSNKKLFKISPEKHASSQRRTMKPIKYTLFGIVDNLSTPSYMINHFLQGDPRTSIKDFWRFFINSTLGIFGMFDIAGTMGLEKKPTSYKKTFILYGVTNGPFIVAPIVGATSVRNTIAALLEILTNPISFLFQHQFVSFAVYNCTKIAREIDYYPMVIENSIDPYVRLRALTLNYDGTM